MLRTLDQSCMQAAIIIMTFIQVVVRIRPLNSKEIKAGAKSIVHPVDDKVLILDA